MKRRAKGFTLVEVLVALAIVTIGMAALLSALGSSADSASYQRDKTLAEWVALNRIEEVRLALQRPKKGKSDGEMEMAGEKWKWAQEVLETEVKGIVRVDVSVRPLNVPGKDGVWYTTVSGIVGDALAPPSGDMDPYATAVPLGNPSNPNPQNPQNPQNPRNPRNPQTPQTPQNGENDNNGGNDQTPQTPPPTD